MYFMAQLKNRTPTTMGRDTNPTSAAARQGIRIGRVARAGTAAVLALALSGAAHAFPSLNLTPGTPDIESAFINVDYVGNNTTGTLTASGFAQVLTPPGSPAGNIAGGSFDINATINFNALTASGSLGIGGTVAGLGFNSGTLLTGTFSSTAGNQAFGSGPGDPLEFLFDITGGDAAGLYGGIGSTAGVILSQSGYSGSFASNFSSAPFGGLADTFGIPQVDAPATLALMLLGGVLVCSRRRRATTGTACACA